MTPEAMRDEIETLREENRQLREMAFGSIPEIIGMEYGLSKYQARILAVLLQHEVASFRNIEAALWWDKEPPEDTKVIAVQVCKMRKLLPDWARPQSVWGIGYRLLPEARKRLQAIEAGEADRDAA